MIKLLTIRSKNENYTADVFDRGDGSFEFTGDMDNDVDGTPFWHKDPCGQADVTLHYHGHPVDGSKVRGIVLPPEVIKAVHPPVLGCRAEVTYRGKSVLAVVYDVGPHYKLGEGNPALMTALGIHWTENGNGGVDEPEVLYRFWPGVAAVVDGVEYQLQHYGG